ncbi:MAG: bacteriocin [Okeania sp. SIO2C9]|uniref:bacteriocin n=1 Tax=Okeania sp. SIO2C9 TaxID=2607791 RepID=UPI0013C10692|nr:bacteriocin [Okeania sp. SIO2C9]NEQ73504.1 bacteriocin [Okeania sp. SIO2C9]
MNNRTKNNSLQQANYTRQNEKFGQVQMDAQDVEAIASYKKLTDEELENIIGGFCKVRVGKRCLS